MPFPPQPHVIQLPWAVARQVFADALGRPIGNIGPITSDVACYQRMRNVVAVRPLTGETLWTRSDIEPGSDIFGDDELLFIVAPESEDTLVVRALDGQELGRRKIAPSSQRMMTLGRKVASWRIDSGKALLEVRDPWTNKEIWSRRFDDNSKAWVVGDEGVGVMTPSGNFDLMSWADGRALVSDKVPPPRPQLNEMYVLRGPDQYVVVASHTRVPAPNGVSRMAGPGVALISGNVYFYDRETGKKTSSVRVDQQGLLLNQPAALPVLVFATNIYNVGNNRRGQNHEADVTLLDKRTGKVVFNRKFDRQLAVEVVGDPDRHQVTMKTPVAGICLTFTGKAITETSGATSGEESDSKKAGKAVLRGLQNWFQSVTPPVPVIPGE